jgi:hypothetical protein
VAAGHCLGHGRVGWIDAAVELEAVRAHLHPQFASLVGSIRRLANGDSVFSTHYAARAKAMTRSSCALSRHAPKISRRAFEIFLNERDTLRTRCGASREHLTVHFATSITSSPADLRLAPSARSLRNRTPLACGSHPGSRCVYPAPPISASRRRYRRRTCRVF